MSVHASQTQGARSGTKTRDQRRDGPRSACPQGARALSPVALQVAILVTVRVQEVRVGRGSAEAAVVDPRLVVWRRLSCLQALTDERSRASRKSAQRSPIMIDGALV